MYLALYDENQNHITNIDNVTYELTRRVYDPDTFTADGESAVQINNAKIAVLCDDAGNYVYSAFVDYVTPENNTRTVKGLDFKTIFNTDILIDYTSPGAFDGRLSKIFTKAAKLVTDDPDRFMQTIPLVLNIPDDETDTILNYGTRQGEYIVSDAYEYLKCYLKFYEYNVEARYSEAAGQIIIDFVKHNESVDIALVDFIYELQTNSDTVNKAVATIAYDIKTPETDTDGNIIYSDVQETDESGAPVTDADGNPTRHNETGISRCEFVYDEQGLNVVEKRYFGPDDALTLRKDIGYAILRSDYDESGRFIGESYFGIDGKPTLHKVTGRAGFEKILDESGNDLEVASFGLDGRPILAKMGNCYLR